MKKLMSIIGVVALMVGTGVAQEVAPRVEKMRGKHKAMLNDIPDLTEEQRAQIEEIHTSGKKQMQPQREQAKKVRLKLMELKSADNPDQKQINALIDSQAKVKAEMMKARTASELKVRQVLTPEQRKVVDAKKKEHMQRRQKRMEQKKTMYQEK